MCIRCTYRTQNCPYYIWYPNMKKIREITTSSNSIIHKMSELPRNFPGPIRNNVSFLHGKTVPPRIFFSPQAEVFPRSAFSPEGRLYARAKRGLVIETQGGKGCPRIHFCLRRKKYPRWDRFAMEDVTFFQFGGNSLRRVNV